MAYAEPEQWRDIQTYTPHLPHGYRELEGEPDVIEFLHQATEEQRAARRQINRLLEPWGYAPVPVEPELPATRRRPRRSPARAQPVAASSVSVAPQARASAAATAAPVTPEPVIVEAPVTPESAAAEIPAATLAYGDQWREMHGPTVVECVDLPRPDSIHHHWFRRLLKRVFGP